MQITYLLPVRNLAGCRADRDISCLSLLPSVCARVYTVLISSYLIQEFLASYNFQRRMSRLEQR